MFNDHGQKVEHAVPATPVEILGLAAVPIAGEEFFVVPDEKQAKEIIALREAKQRQEKLQPVKRISLEDLHTGIQEGIE